MHLVGPPADGFYRAGRWGDVDTYPPPSPRISLARDVLDGYRWEDLHGEFSTAKFSASAEGALGRTFARYKRRELPDDGGTGIVDAIMRYMSGKPDPGEPELLDGRVPEDIFDDLYLIHVPQDREVLFVDLGHDETHAALNEQLRATLERMGAGPIDSSLIQAADRRLTRLVMRALWSLCSEGRFGPVAGIRYPGQPDPPWEAYVVWCPPDLMDLTGEDVGFRWVAWWDAEAKAAAATLGIELPGSDEAEDEDEGDDEDETRRFER